MDKATTKALKKSIKHWKRNVKAKMADDVRLGGKDCALCQLFVLKNGYCDGCPISTTTGVGECVGTPYGDTITAFELWVDLGDGTQFKQAAQAMVDFLENLLEEGKS